MPLKEIGGYFGLELQKGAQYYPDAIRLNSGRNCFKYILKAQKPSKVYIPYYVDKSMIEPLNTMKIDFEFYSINKEFEIAGSIPVKEAEKILYVDYYALKKKYTLELAEKYGDKLIIDNTQAFFSRPIPKIDTLYSIGSKFFGVSDGGYLYTDKLLKDKLGYDFSYNRMVHLCGRIDKSAHEFFGVFQESKKERTEKEIMVMSKLTQAILSSIDYEKAKIIRERNFYYLHSFLKDLNELNADMSAIEGPMVYPFLIKKEGLRQKLIEKMIYVPTYWKEVLDFKSASNDEKYIASYLLPLPIDQRYDTEDMKIIADAIKKEV